jgi:hypothetical protein
MSMQGHLEERDARAEADRRQAERDAAARVWMNQAQKPEARLAAFDRWLLRELDRRLVWTSTGAEKVKRLHQCRVQVDGLVLALWRRGWMLDGTRLADRITEMLDPIGKAQRGGQVRDFWPYFKTACGRYVGLNAEEIQAEAMSAGAAVGAVFQQLLKRQPAGASMPELVAQRHEETLREKVNRQKAQERRQAAHAAQLPLL